MLEQLAIYLIVSFVISYFLTKDIFHPAVIMSGLWMVMVVLYAYTEHPLYPLSNKFCVALAFWVTPFIILSIVTGRCLPNMLVTYKSSRPKIELYLKLYPFVKFYAFVYIISLIYYAGGSFVNIRHFLVFGNFPPFLKFLMYINNFMIAYVAYGLLNYKFFSKRKLIILMVLLLIVTLFNGNKTGFLSLFVISFYIFRYLNGGISMKRAVGLIILLIVFLILITYTRNDMEVYSGSQNPILDYIYIYVLSPLPAFDLLLNSNAILDPGSTGSATFSFFYTVFNYMGADYKIAQLGTWVHVPLITNVFTIMRGYYLDWGMMGILIMSFVMGGIWGTLYSLQKKKYPVYVLFYALIVCYLFFQTFGDYFWHSMSVVIQYFVFSLFLSKGFKVSV